MSLETREREREGIVLLDCKGRLIAGSEAEAFRKATRILADDGKVNLILNLQGIDAIDSTGLGEMVALYSYLQEKNGQVKLLNLDKRHIELLVITKLTTVFELYDDEQDAVNSFFPDRKVRTFDLLSFVHEMKEQP